MTTAADPEPERIAPQPDAPSRWIKPIGSCARHAFAHPEDASSDRVTLLSYVALPPFVSEGGGSETSSRQRDRDLAALVCLMGENHEKSWETHFWQATQTQGEARGPRTIWRAALSVHA